VQVVLSIDPSLNCDSTHNLILNCPRWFEKKHGAKVWNLWRNVQSRGAQVAVASESIFFETRASCIWMEFCCCYVLLWKATLTVVVIDGNKIGRGRQLSDIRSKPSKDFLEDRDETATILILTRKVELIK
jgi:hypothetical protein